MAAKSSRRRLACARAPKYTCPRHVYFGAGEGNRTLVVSLEGFCSTIELHPRRACRLPCRLPAAAVNMLPWVAASCRPGRLLAHARVPGNSGSMRVARSARTPCSFVGRRAARDDHGRNCASRGVRAIADAPSPRSRHQKTDPPYFRTAPGTAVPNSRKPTSGGCTRRSTSVTTPAGAATRADRLLRQWGGHFRGPAAGGAGGEFGLGLLRNVRAFYRYLCRNYRDGDVIFAFGFSRGAFTIRLFVALVAKHRSCSMPKSETDLDYRFTMLAGIPIRASGLIVFTGSTR